MKRMIWIAVLAGVWLYAEKVSITKQQEKNWDIQVQKPQVVTQYPFGEFIARVVTPPSLLRTVSLPFEANVQRLYAAKYQKVAQGTLLAEVTGTAWIEVQRQAISDAIEYRHHKHLMERKEKLCKAEIIPKKECVAARAEFQNDRIKIEAAKTMLKSYGASGEDIARLFETLKLNASLKVVSPVQGNIIAMHAKPGETVTPNEALFVLQQPGALWLEADIEAYRTLRLKEGEKVRITMLGSTFESRVLQLSPVVNPVNQTRQVRFEIPPTIPAASGLVGSATLMLVGNVVKVKKASVIKEGGVQIVFAKINDTFVATPVTVLSEDDDYYYLKPSERLIHDIAVNSVAILKNLLGGNDE